MNKITLVSFCLAFLMFQTAVNAQETLTINLDELDNPQYLTANQNFLLITDNHTVKMYGMKHFKLIKTIGKKGEGPGEFISLSYPQILSDSIMISSENKVSFFDFSGNLIKEKKTKSLRPIIKKINDKYVTDSIQREKNDFYISYNIYNPDFSMKTVFFKGKWMIHMGGKRDLFEIYFFDVYYNKIIFAHREGFDIEILNENGKTLHSIKLSPTRIPFTTRDMDYIIKDMESNTKNKGYVQYIKNQTIKPVYFPDIRTCRVADGKIYVVTYLKQKGRSECLIFNLEGRQLKRVFIPLRDTSAIRMPPFTIHNDRLFQLIEDVDNEQWNLVIDKIG